MNLEQLNNDIPLKAFVLRTIRIMESKGYKVDNFVSKIYKSSIGTYINISMINGKNDVLLSINPLDDDIYMTVSNEKSQVLIKGYVDLDKLSKLNIDNLLTKVL